MPDVMCVDCKVEGITTSRPIVGGGPRTPLCRTHVRARRKKASAARHEAHVARTFSLPTGMYQKLYEAQGGLCAICGLTTGASGKSKRMPVDHDHKCCPGPTSCGKCIRGLVCGKCNEILGYYRDDPGCFLRGAAYLEWPPAWKILGRPEEQVSRTQ